MGSVSGLACCWGSWVGRSAAGVDGPGSFFPPLENSRVKGISLGTVLCQVERVGGAGKVRLFFLLFFKFIFSHFCAPLEYRNLSFGFEDSYKYIFIHEWMLNLCFYAGQGLGPILLSC